MGKIRKKIKKFYRYGTRRTKKTGLSPGTLVYTGDREEEEEIKIDVFNFNEDLLEEKSHTDVSELEQYNIPSSVTWINITGLNNVKVLQQLGDMFDIHHLALEDILSVGQRPKFEEYENHLFMVIRMIYHNEEEVESEQVSFVLKDNLLISFQERQGDLFEPIRHRIRAGSRIRQSGHDYVGYALLDMIIDGYFLVLEKIGEQIELLEDVVLYEKDQQQVLRKINELKSSLIFLRKTTWPVRELVSSMSRSENPLIKKQTHVFLRDLHDHAVQVIDTVETYRDLLGGILDIHLSSISNKMNEVMKVLTIIATIFIPLTFIAGVYGMNFTHMPELETRYGYYIVWGIMIIAALIMLIYFKKKRWL